MARKKPNKSEFVRSLPASMTAKDVVAKAKEQGMAITPAYVYVIRGKSKTKKGGRRASSTSTTTTTIRRGKPGDGEFARIIERIVEAKVQEILRAKFG